MSRQSVLADDVVDVPRRPLFWSSDEWSTPQKIIDELTREFGAFDLDPCCRVETAKAPRYFTLAENGLLQKWDAKRIWLNPPYSNPSPWLRRAVQAARDGSLVLALLPVSTCTGWFHDLVLPFAEIRYIRGRVRFIGWVGTPICAPKSPSLIAIYRQGLNA